MEDNYIGARMRRFPGTLSIRGTRMRSWRFLVLVLSMWRPAPAVDAPFTFVHNQIVLEVGIGGRGPFNFVLDTGTHGVVIDLELARQLRLPLEARRIRSVGAGSGRTAGRRTTIESLRAGGLELERIAATALPLAGFQRELGRPLHGVFGSGLLASRIVQVDYLHRRVRFLDSPPFGVPPSDAPRRISFPMQSREGSALPVLEDCEVNGVRIPVTIDTGSSLGLILFPAAVRRLGLERLARQGAPLGAAGYRGRARLTRGWVRSLKLKDLDLGAIEAAYVESGYGDGEPLERRGGNLGNATLQDFTLTLDYWNRVVTLEALDDAPL